MLGPVAKRQSDPRSSVPERQQRIKLAAYVGARVRAAMERRGWVSDDGKPEVKRLQAAVEQAGGFRPGQPRWQTVQEWIEGKTPPSTKYTGPLAQALGMTLAELMGAATGEPVYPAWAAFLETAQGKTVTPEERQALASQLWPHGPPTVAHYSLLLTTIRHGSS